ncbi:MAG: penicillin-binding protein 2 [Rhodospirillales bacterium]|nr:penicillin-binding protein 2 [Rhodospirillales bacterium]
MLRDAERQKLFTRRMALLAGGKLALFSLLAGRMYYLQVLESDRYKTLADENRINLRLLPPPRGRIVDRYGAPLAVNERNFRVLVTPEQAGDLEATLHAIGKIVPVSEETSRRILREARRRRSFVPLTVRENLEWEDVARIEVNAPDLPGVMIDVGQTRRYLYPAETAHVLGYVAAVSERELTGDPLLELPGFRVGKSGVEKIHDLALRGTGGSSQVEVNAFGRVIRELARKEGQPGGEVRLTIDLELQKSVAKRLGDESASAVVLDVHTGEVLTLVSTPAYDPNAFNRGLSGEEWRNLNRDSLAPLVNKAITGLYAPGSTFKIAVALAALERGVVTPGQRVHCPGFLELGDARFHCWRKRGHGWVDLHTGISRSCDVYFYELARRLGVDRISQMANRLGLGVTHDLDLPGERAGLMPTRKWKLEATGVPWQGGETLIAGVGQGYILSTPLQLAIMTARLVNGGLAVTPRLTRELRVGFSEEIERRESTEPFKSLGLNPLHVELVRAATDAVVNEPGGTAYAARIAKRGFEMGGKTGTTQVRRISKAEREQGLKKSHELPWIERDHALFVGYAPVAAPRYAAAVVVEHGGGGGAVAAPIVRDILLLTQERGRRGDGVLRTAGRAGLTPSALNDAPLPGRTAPSGTGG